MSFATRGTSTHFTPCCSFWNSHGACCSCKFAQTGQRHARDLLAFAEFGNSEKCKPTQWPQIRKLRESCHPYAGCAWYEIRKLREMYQSLMRKIRKLRELRSGKYPEIPNSAHPRTHLKSRGAVCRFKAMNTRRRYCCTRQSLKIGRASCRERV